MDVPIYEDSFGYSPFKEWPTNLRDKNFRARILSRFARIQARNLGDYKYLEQGIFELRFMFGAGYRIYFGMIDRKILLLLLGGDKDSQKKDIQTAAMLLTNFLRTNP